VKKHCKKHPGTLKLQPILGGITNKLFKATLADDDCPILIRVYGDGGLIDRVTEIKSFLALAEAGLGPGSYGTFANGRLEHFFEGFRTLSPSDLCNKERSLKIASQLAQSHAAIPLHPPPGQSRVVPSLWGQLSEWMQGAQQAAFAEKTLEATTYATIDLVRIQDHIEELKSKVKSTFEIVFCHNDLLAANILEDPVTGTLKLIDFEYGGANYRAFDIANHFNEWAGGTEDGKPDYDRLPTETQKYDFCRAYLRERRQQHELLDDDEEEEEVKVLINQVNLFLILNHYYWGLWAVNMGCTKGCETFPYLRFI